MSATQYGGLSVYDVAPFTGEASRLNEIKFLKDIRHKVQEDEDKLRGMFQEESGVGAETVRFNFLDESAEPQELTQRFNVVFPGSNYGSSVDGDIAPSTYAFSERWCFPKHLIDVKYAKKDEDVLSQLSINSNLAKSIHKAYNRKRTKVCLEAAVGSAWAGPRDNMTQISLPSSQIIPEDDLGLTYEKILEAQQILNDNDVDDENRVCFYSSEQLRNAFGILEIKNKDYNAMQDLVHGKHDMFLGFKFIRISAKILPYTDNGDGTYTRKVIFLHGDGVGKCVWTGDSASNIKIEQLAHIMYDTQITSWETYNALRLEEKLVVQCNCLETQTPKRLAA